MDSDNMADNHQSDVQADQVIFDQDSEQVLLQDLNEDIEEEEVVSQPEDVDSHESEDYHGEESQLTMSRMIGVRVDPVVEYNSEYDFEQHGYSNIPVPEIESDYAPSEGIRSIHSDDDKSDYEGGFPENMSLKDINAVPILDVGIKFSDAREFRCAVNQNAIYYGFDYDIKRNDSDRITLTCKSCTWRIHASYDKRKEYFQIKTLQSEHSCERVSSNTRCTASWLGRKYVDYFRRDPEMKLVTLQTKIQKELQLDVTHHVLVNAKKEALRIIDGLVRDQYHRLHDYAGMLLERHPGSQIKLSPHRPLPDGPLHFHRFYIGFHKLVRGFWDGCRPFIGLDGCHLRNGKSSILLSAVSRDANNQMYPISYAIVEGESRETWTWFLENLMQSLGEQNTRITFMSDRQKGLVETFSSLLPNHEHRFCVRHIYANMLKLKTGLGQGILKELLWGAAAASTSASFNMKMDKIKSHSQVAFQYLSEIPKNLWTRSAFSFNSSCDLLSNNLSESFNFWIVKARELPMLSLVDTIRKQLMVRLEHKKMNETKFTNNICPRIVDKVTQLKRLAMKYGRAEYAGNELFEVTYQTNDLEMEQYAVDLNGRTCQCRMWQISGIPCVHAISAIIKRRRDVLSHVSCWYSKEVYLKAYSGQLLPIPGPVQWPRRNFEHIEPPIWKPMPGRPKKKRRRGIDETERVSNCLRVGERQRCTKCHGYGHNRVKCTYDVVERTSDINRGGRPPIHGRYSGRKRAKANIVSDSGEGSSGATNRGRGGGRGTKARGLHNNNHVSPMQQDMTEEGSTGATNRGRGGGRGTRARGLHNNNHVSPVHQDIPHSVRRSPRPPRGGGGAASWFQRRPWI